MDKSSENKLYSGLLIYRLQRNVEYLLLNDSFTNKKHWFFPEGEVKGNEDEVKCALRETNELIRLDPQDLHVESFKIQYKYLVGNTVKKVNIHVAQMVDSHMRLPPGADGIHYMWCNQANAVEKITTRSIDMVFKNAQEMIEHKIKTHPPQNRRPRVSNDTNDHRPRNATTAAPARPDQQRVDGMVTHQRPSPQQQPQRRQPENPLYKTRLCERFEKDGTCSYGVKCHFAHGVTELRERVHEEDQQRPPARQSGDGPSAPFDSKFTNPLYKTKLCERYHKEKFCQYGPKCHFAHGRKELREQPAEFDNNYIRPIEEENMRPSKYRQELKRRQQYAEAADGAWQTRAPNNDNKREGTNGKSPIQNGWSPTANPWPSMQHAWKTDKPSSTTSNGSNNEGRSTNDNDGWRKADAASNNTNGWSNTNNNNSDSATNSIKPDKRFDDANKENSRPVSNPKPVPITTIERKPVVERATNSVSSDSSDSRSLTSERTNTPIQEMNGSLEETHKSWLKTLQLSQEQQKKMDILSPATSPSPGPNKTNPEDTLINELRNAFKEYPGKNGVETGTMRPDIKAVTKMEMRNDLPKRQLLYIILASMFDEKDCRVTTKIEARLPLFTTFVKTASDERMLLKAWEKLVTDRMPTLLSRTNHMCSAFYQHDILSEEVFEAWHKSLDEDNKVKRSADKFRDWLMSEDD